MILKENYTLSNGLNIPKIGLGTWHIKDQDAAQAVKDAVDIGYRHIDSAQAYENEVGVGEGVNHCGVDRSDIFLTTKLSAGIKSYAEAVESIDGSLQKLGVDYIDLMIIHSPQPWDKFGSENRYFEGNLEAWRALEEAYEAGKLKSIGVSNFQQEDIENILSHCKIKPMVNQFLAHVTNTPHELISYCKEQNILFEAYSPIAHGELLENKDISALAKKYDVSIPQLCIRYTLQLGLLPLPKTSNPEHMKNNADVDFEISSADMDALKSMKKIEYHGEAGKLPIYS